MKSAQNLFWPILVSLLCLSYASIRIFLWYEKTELREERLIELVTLIDVHVLKEKDILYFSDTRQRRFWNDNASRFVFFSDREIIFSNLNVVSKISSENANERRGKLLQSSAALIAKDIGYDIGTPLERIRYEMVSIKNQININVIETKNGFFIDVRNIEK